MNGPSALFEISHLWYTYTAGTRRILDIPSLTLHEGECIALLGPNGSGKTSLLKLLNHLLPWQDDPSYCGGELYFRHRPYTRDVARRVSVYLHQHPWILRGTVAENIAAVGCSP
ncbi:MAG: ATP-binding cassette domain-containing protein, partial [Spirochaetales bacterium]|nr:ATP-binding cassette domain-containing protein [Spirochaetales bacterium]